MLRDSVAQKPTMPVRPGMKNFQNSPNVANLLGSDMIGPMPPALPIAQMSMMMPMAMRIGAA